MNALVNMSPEIFFNRGCRRIALPFLLLLSGCLGERSGRPVRNQVEVASGLPAAIRDAVMKLSLVATNGPSANDWIEKIGGSRSLRSPVGSGSDSFGHFSEQMLLAIRSDGFVMLFTKREGAVEQTNVIVFPYDQTTQTNALGWKITGRYKSP